MKGNLSDVGCHENSKLPTVHNILARFPKSAIPAYKFPPDVCSDATKEHGRSACFVSLFENRGGRQKEPLLSSWYSQLMAKSLKKFVSLLCHVPPINGKEDVNPSLASQTCSLLDESK